MDTPSAFLEASDLFGDFVNGSIAMILFCGLLLLVTPRR